MTVTKKKWTIKSTEARISKPNFAKITSASSQKKMLAEIYCREKQSLLFTEAVLGFNLNHASKGKKSTEHEIDKVSIELELQGQISFQMGCGVWGFELRRLMEIRNRLFK